MTHLALILLILSGQTIDHRPFRMGFTPWPYDISMDGVETARTFAQSHGDILSVMMIGGIPWVEADAGQPYSRDVQSTLAYRPANKKLFVSISPLDQSRSGLAPYWGEKDNLPLPEPWASMRLNNPRVKAAFLKFAIDVVETMHPDTLAIGIEDNVLLSKSPEKWPDLKELHRDTYRALKRRYPALPVCFTTEVSHYLGQAAESKGKPQASEVADLMQTSDLFAMSFYPYLNLNYDDSVVPGFLDFAHKFGKPIAVSESGMTSQDVALPSYHVTLHGTPALQSRFESFLLNYARRDHYQFVINFASTDFDPLVARIGPPSNEVASIWEYTGMQTSSKTPKPALAVWDRVFQMPYKS